MLTVHKISKSYGFETILEGVSFNLNAGERLALVGPNGCGKTTLLRILAGLEQADSGGIQYDPPALRLGYLPQGFNLTPDGDPVPDTIEDYLAGTQGDPAKLAAQLEELASSLAHTPGRRDLQREYDLALARLEVASQNAGRAPSVLAALGLGGLAPTTRVSELSGGQKTRLALAGVLLSEPQLLLLDEPTNHLDLAMLAWLEGWLLAFRGTVLLVSHDRALLDRTSTAILELDPHTHRVRSYAGNYSDYIEQKLNENARQWEAYKQQQTEIGHLQKAAARVRGDARFRRGGKADSGDKFAKGFFSDQSSGTMARARFLERRLERLLGDDRVDKPKGDWQMKLDFGETPPSGQSVLMLEDLSVGYGSKVILENLNAHLWHGARLALIGPNGSGKTTLLRTIAGDLPPLAGRVRLGANVRLGVMTQEQEELDPALDAFTTIRKLAPLSETDARAFLHKFLFSGEEVFQPIRSLSYGERARLSLACLVASGVNLLLLDEPINHLDIPSRARFEAALADFEGTILAVVHDRYFIEGFTNEIWEIKTDSQEAGSTPTLKTWQL
jgi:ATP-binding cassette subfamily F protein 3